MMRSSDDTNMIMKKVTWPRHLRVLAFSGVEPPQEMNGLGGPCDGLGTTLVRIQATIASDGGQAA